MIQDLVALTVLGATACWAQGPTIQGLDPTGRLTFAEIAGASGYQVEWKPSMGAQWTNLGAAVFSTGSGTVSVAILPLAVTTAFYRVAAAVAGAAPADMALIPAGSFSMGDSFIEGDYDERPVHTVYVSAFYMDKTEVTKAKWDEVKTWATTNGYAFDNAGLGKATNHPVHTVSWYDVVKWSNARSQKEGLTPCYTVGGAVYKTGQSAPDCNWSAGGYRLPTEAEWEKAARGGASGQRFPWGSTIDHNRANYYGNPSGYTYDAGYQGYDTRYATGGTPHTSPVGSFEANGYGLFDMVGNMCEWCWDWFQSYKSGSQSDPRGPATGSDRVYRGGAWSHLAAYCRTPFRDIHEPSIRYYFIGFRSVRPPGQ